MEMGETGRRNNGENGWERGLTVNKRRQKMREKCTYRKFQITNMEQGETGRRRNSSEDMRKGE